MEGQPLPNDDHKPKNVRWGFKVWFPIMWLTLVIIGMAIAIVVMLSQTAPYVGQR